MPLNNIKREDLSVNYKHAPLPDHPYVLGAGLSGVVNQSMPLAAMFLRNKYIGWFALVQALHYYLNTDEKEFAKAQKKSGSNSTEQTPFVKLCLAILGLAVSYMNLIFPAPAPPLPSEDKIVEGATEAITTAVETSTE